MRRSRARVNGNSSNQRDLSLTPEAALSFLVPVTEGNYLLLGDAPWDAVKPLLDLAVFIDVPREKVRSRLMRRHAEEGLFSKERNRERISRVGFAEL